MRPSAYQVLWIRPEFCMVIINILISQLGSWQLREDKGTQWRNNEARIQIQFCLFQSTYPCVRSGCLIAVQPLGPPRFLLSPPQSWASLGLPLAASGEANGPFPRGHQWRPSGPRPTRTGFCWESGGTQSTKISNVVSLRKENYKYAANFPLADALSAAIGGLGRVVSAVHGIWALLWLTHSGGL